MGILRKAFGPSKDDVWRALAKEIDADFDPGGFWKGSVVRAEIDEWTVTLDTYTVSSEHSHVTYTRLRAPFVNKGGFRFSVHRKHLFSPLGRLLGMQDITVGHRAFDEAFVLKGNDERQVRRLFSHEPLRRAIEAQPQVSLAVRDDEGWFGKSFPDGVDMLVFQVPVVIKDVERLKALFDLFAETLRALCHIGSAYEDDPGLVL